MKEMSSKAKLLNLLREKQGVPISGTSFAKEMGISRVAVWKTVQSLVESGYSIETGETGYLLNPKNEKDFLYPWEFGDKEGLFYHYKNTESTMDRAREMAINGALCGSVFTAEKQSAGKGRNGRTWVSRQGGLFVSILERPRLTIADYTLHSIAAQIAVVRCVSSVCGKQAFLRWPNDIYINNKKIAGISTEISGEGDLITWLTTGIGININNPSPSAKAISCAEIAGHYISRYEILNKLLKEYETVKNTFDSAAAYSQGNRALAAEWNKLADCIGAKAAVFEPEYKDDSFTESSKILARGIFSGMDPVGRCILKTEDKTMYFNQGSVSLAFLRNKF
ncbi:MAG: biotin--[acetyl-CoA-carboxylase] ligase [Treponema sp.]|nr:biotin--[acetyl-CoA-carboxylase] ligase [Treponema sp.]